MTATRSVAPLAGARIEIPGTTRRRRRRQSLPSRERGLKYRQPFRRLGRSSSLPSRERGLKLIKEDYKMSTTKVAPLAGARIEIILMTSVAWVCTSLPSRERGLKFPDLGNERIDLQSLPSRERGLKLKRMYKNIKPTKSLPSRERGLKYCLTGRQSRVCGRSPRGSAD